MLRSVSGTVANSQARTRVTFVSGIGKPALVMRDMTSARTSSRTTVCKGSAIFFYISVLLYSGKTIVSFKKCATVLWGKLEQAPFTFEVVGLILATDSCEKNLSTLC